MKAGLAHYLCYCVLGRVQTPADRWPDSLAFSMLTVCSGSCERGTLREGRREGLLKLLSTKTTLHSPSQRLDTLFTGEGRYSSHSTTSPSHLRLYRTNTRLLTGHLPTTASVALVAVVQNAVNAAASERKWIEDSSQRCHGDVHHRVALLTERWVGEAIR